MVDAVDTSRLGSLSQRSVESLVPYARNARKHSEQQLDLLAKSMLRFGFTNPVLVAKDGTIIAGHGRVLAARRLGWREIPVLELPHLEGPELRAYILADNRLAELASWDEEILGRELADLQALDTDLAEVGFDARQIDRYIQAVLAPEEEAQVDDDATPEPPKVPVTLVGDLWHLGPHRLICGDATDRTVVGRVLAGAKPHLMVTDPPYGVNYEAGWRDAVGHGARNKGKVQNDDRADWQPAWDLFPGDVAYIWHSAKRTVEVAASLVGAGFDLRYQIIIWRKQHFALSRGDYHWQHEPCFYVTRKGRPSHFRGNRSQTTIWDIANHGAYGSSGEETWGHSTQKPIECMRRPIVNNSQRGDAVYDPFLGSGTTLIAAERTGRICYGVELDPVYCDVIVRRWQKLTGQIATLDGGAAFAEVETDRLAAA